jgi:Uncharacterised nucleotidyltransferase
MVSATSNLDSGVSPEERLLRLLVATHAVRMRLCDHLAALAAAVDFEALARTAAAHGLLALAGARLHASSEHPLPPSFERAVEEALQGQRARGLAQEAAGRAAAAALEGEGIAVVPLKGTFLAQAAYGDLGLRTSADVDLLVAPADFGRAGKLLGESGWRMADDPLRAGRPELHRTFRPERAENPILELHWRIHWYDDGTFARRLVAGRRPDGSGLARLAPADGLAALILFHVRDGLAGLRYPADIAAWWDAFGAEVPDGGLAELASGHPRVSYALEAGARAVGELVGLPAGSLLAGRPPPGRRVRAAIRLANWTVAGSPGQREADRALIDLLLGPEGDIGRFVRRHMVPPAGFARRLYGNAPVNPARRAWIRASHPVRRLARHALALWQVRGGRRRVAVPPLA